jgi:hypothetical protein
VKTIVALDRKGRPGGLLVRQLYNKLYPNEKPLNTFFLNPDEINMDYYYLKEHTPPDLKDKNKLLYRHLLKNPDEPIAIIDEYINSGKTMAYLKEYLEKSGFKEIYSIPFGIRDSNRSFYSDFPGTIVGGAGIPWDLHTDSLVGVREESGKSFAYVTKDARKLRKELKQLAGEISKEHSKNKPSGLEKAITVISMLSIVLGIAIGYPSLTGNVVAEHIKGSITAGALLFVLGILGVFLTNKK